ncbi:MAG: hypothetical protein NTY35_06305 [Planctomycetota bacterium]|nr:hypothetical protein [Planctomycetota bacterium]
MWQFDAEQVAKAQSPTSSYVIVEATQAILQQTAGGPMMLQEHMTPLDPAFVVTVVRIQP